MSDSQSMLPVGQPVSLPGQFDGPVKMLPQPRLRFLLADDPGAGKTITTGLLVKELKLREAIECVWPQRWDLIIIDEAHKCNAYSKH